MDLLLGLDGVVLDDLVVELRHLLGGFDVGQVQVLDLGLLDPCPGEKEGDVVLQLPDLDIERVAGLQIRSDEPALVASNCEAWTLTENALLGLGRVDGRVEILIGAVEGPVVDLLLPEVLARLVRSVVGARLQTGDRSLRNAVGAQ
ncbi:MAG TPA: hypothetical protein VND98_10570 [Solirubrobacterales bacterium]|nr:hypothetical protein [Solirubrobacterales bacterium]